MRATSGKLLLALGVLLIASVGCNVLLLSALHTSFAKLQFARIFPLGYNGQGTPRSFGSGPHSIAFWGDSRAQSWARSQVWKDRAVLDFAHGGQTSNQLLLQLKTSAAEKSDVAVVQVGINDLHPLGALPELKQEAIARLRANIVSIRDLLLERSDIVVLTTIFPAGPVPWLRRDAWDPRTPRYIQDVNAAIREASNHERVVLLDAYGLLVGSDSQLAEGNADEDFFLHVNPKGYARLNGSLQQVLDRPSR